jgi:tRNA pseudouridine38-40 synthase
MPKYLSFIQYNGSPFNGFQIQNDNKTIYYFIEKALLKLPYFEGKIGYAGRTDSKVHALANAISFNLNKDFDSNILTKILNSYLPHEIRVISTKKVADNFNQRYDAIKRTYLYVIYYDYFLPPFLLNKVFFLYRENNKNLRLNISILKEILSLFKGYHNFEAYTTSQEKRNKFRTIFEIIIKEKKTNFFSNTGFFYFIQISGKSFLHKQIRAIIGATLKAYTMYEKKLEELNSIKLKISNSLENGKKPFIFSYIDPSGLYLKKVLFKKDIYLE